MSAFIEDVRRIEKRLFADQLDLTDATRMKNDGKYSWLYRPSHHVKTGLITQGDVTFLSQPGKRLLSVGAHPLHLERMLVELGVPTQNILAADHDPAIMDCAGSMEKIVFDATRSWPQIGTFDLIIFPESLCIAVGDSIKREGGSVSSDIAFPNDAREAELLAATLGKALKRLRSDGEIRANGPMSHPAVVKKAVSMLEKSGLHPSIEYKRYFLTVRPA